MQCYSLFHNIRFDIHFDRAEYQQFLREQELSEHDITYLDIHLIDDFTLSHFLGDDDLAPGGAFSQRGEEYVEQKNMENQGLYRSVDSHHPHAAIFVRPHRCCTSARLNHVFLHETRHHIQQCQNMSWGEVPAWLEWKDRPWEIDAEKFAYKFAQSHTFLHMVDHTLQRSDLSNDR